jgi:hypothetical protein
MCYKEIYVTATTLPGVGVRVTCGDMALGVALAIFCVENDYVSDNTDALSQNVTSAAMLPSHQSHLLSRSPTVNTCAA